MKYYYDNKTIANKLSNFNLNFFILVILFVCLSFTNSQNVRFTVSGRQCVFPAKYKGVEYNNCIVNEKGQEWCYFDKMGISWDFCARGDFRIDSSILIKNIGNKREFCLFNYKPGKKIYSIECEFLLQIKKHKLDQLINLDTNSFEFFWINKSQIKTKEEEKCLHPVETPIISNNKISYFGFVESKQCIINDDLTINNSQKWKIDESGRIINEYFRKCLVRSEEKKKLSDLFKLTKELDEDYDAFSVNIGECIGNTKGYQGREFWVLEEFRPEMLELMALNKLMKVYQNGRNEITKIASESNKNFLKLINYNSKLIDYKSIIDEVESKLESAESKLEKLDVEKNFGLDNKKSFNLNGVLLEGFKDYNRGKPDTRMLVDSFNIKDSFVNILSFINLFNNVDTNFVLKTLISNKFKIIKLSGFFIFNDTEENLVKIKIESNANFMIIMNSKLILENKLAKKEVGVFTTENIKLIHHSLNQIEILLILKDKLDKLQFNASVITSKEVSDLNSLNLIPFTPYEKFCLNKNEFFSNLEYLDCNRQLTSINLEENKTFFCDSSQCKNSDAANPYICKEALDKNIISNKGGLLFFKNENSKVTIQKFDYNMMGLDQMITEVKLGYIEDFTKYTREASEQIFNNYKLQMDIKDNNMDDSFLFYKKFVISNKSENILLDVKLICDNNSNNENLSNYSLDNLANNYKINIIKEKIHDMINGFTIWLFKIKYEDYIKVIEKVPQIKFVEDLKLTIIKAGGKTKNNLDIVSNRIVCSINGKSILLEVKYRNNNQKNINNIPDFHADISTTVEEVVEYSKTVGRTDLNLKCLMSINPQSDPKMQQFKSNLICDAALTQGLITLNGGVFKVKINRENNTIEYDNIFDLPCLQVLSDNYKTFLNSEETESLVSNYLFELGLVSHNPNSKLSSFLELESSSNVPSNKFYSNDLLVKIEQGLNRITDKVIEGSKKMSEVSKINEDLNKKFEKIEKGENSIEIVSKRVNEISKLETNLEERVNKKFLKFKQIIREKEEKIKEIEGVKNNKDEKDYNLKKKISEFFNDWVIIDALDSKNGPSNWNIKVNEQKEEYSITQNSPIFINNAVLQSKNEIASTIILRNITPKKNIYTKLNFSTKSYGSLQINFLYKDYQNYITLQLIKKSADSGSIKLIKVLSGKYSEISDLSCDNMLSVMKKCYGYNTDENSDSPSLNNEIEIYNYENIIQVLFNKKIILKIYESEIDKFNLDPHFSISINNQNSLVISELILKELTIDDVISLKNEGNKKTKKNKRIENSETNEKNLRKINQDNYDSEDKKPKPKLRYNPVTNNFEEDKSQQIMNTNQNSKDESPVPLALSNKFRHSFVKEKCLKYEKEEYVCNYIANVISKNAVNIQMTSSNDISKLIKENCIVTMKNKFICDQILNKLEPIIQKIKSEEDLDSPIQTLKSEKPKNVIKRDINKLINACSFDFLPKLLKNRKICLNEIMGKELESRKMNKDDECVREFCNNCCFINYGNTSCSICKK